MQNFVYANPTKIFFGKDQVNNLGKEIKNFASKILLVYGGKSIKENGVYDKVISQLNNYKIEFHELPGVVANPRISLVEKGVEICRLHDADLVLGVGGGSVIDTAKTIAASVKFNGKPWELFTKSMPINEALPIAAVLTTAATGSESNNCAVITNWERQEKRMISSEVLYPKFSILDPQITYTMLPSQTVFGGIDIIVHILEQYFHNDSFTPIQDGFCETLLKTVINNLPIVLKNGRNYNARANIMWASTLALNGILSTGVLSDWATHAIGQEISAIYDIPHGESLAMVWPSWAMYVYTNNCKRFKQYAVNVWDLSESNKNDSDIALEGIKITKNFFDQLKAEAQINPLQLKVKDEDIELMAKKATENGPIGNFKKLYKEDVMTILRRSF
ncbi:iron-containing alcohol dehydrogenase [Tepidanaerobacter syntrophicus]|uniref:iron-containing alcohol dehydrogenase n=1 Tax=Tepidanaerobacter syntrophicus TaxID=224999 RepID=UPI001BD2CB58|nr:iron-containing alcohol dehydrogenase [Tepidanaerobacter syntrophicus]